MLLLQQLLRQCQVLRLAISWGSDVQKYSMPLQQLLGRYQALHLREQAPHL